MSGGSVETGPHPFPRKPGEYEKEECASCGELIDLTHDDTYEEVVETLKEHVQTVHEYDDN